MEWTIIAVNFLYAVLGVVLMYLSFRVIDRLLPHIDLEQELKGGNIAVAIVVGALFVASAIIVGGALN